MEIEGFLKVKQSQNISHIAQLNFASQNLNISNATYIIIFRSEIPFAELVSNEVLCCIVLVSVKYSRIRVHILACHF